MGTVLRSLSHSAAVDTSMVAATLVVTVSIEVAAVAGNREGAAALSFLSRALRRTVHPAALGHSAAIQS